MQNLLQPQYNVYFRHSKETTIVVRIFGYVYLKCPINFRQLFERVIHMNFSAKKMKFFFKKYLDFEEKYGTEEDVSAVKQKAVEYVQTKTEGS